ncbi:hypothetical protein CC86DRAFT_314995 [Ophiobolus disseminans]|uniref:Uncharacterized protein n=1 Tax=Ophiobolus disseminans TaxID=1469910 RepID=A0A6A7AF83_9PLEO|nr:hypothetical protein CC86DRAFT_314995 [Ophiobolus disseminans]
MRKKAKSIVPPLQQSDFDALPHQVQRKFFSSLEKLQIRQQQDSLDGQHASGRSLSSRSSSIPFRPSLTLGSQRRSPKTEDVLSGLDISQAEVEFFLSLPDKLRKLYYSREEQEALLGKCEQAFLPCDHTFERAQQRFSDFQFGFKKDPNSTSEQNLLRTRSLSDVSSVSPRQESFNLSMQEKEGDTDSSLLYLDAMSPPVSRRSSRRPDVRRTMSLTTSSMHYSSSSAVIMGNPSGFAIAPAPTHQRHHSSSLSGRRSLQTPTPPVFDPEATHYRDPEARKKLRTYLASPQKFDEAIEFGFPSTSGNDTVTPHYQLPPIASHSRKFSRDMQTFLRDGKLSFFEDHSSDNQGLESDEDSVADMESPTTPSSIGHSFRLHSRQISHSKLSTDESSAPSPTQQKGNVNREMTLRMTLTRPDLRANDDQLYGWQPSSPKAPKHDPLALEDLVLTDDMTGTKGAFYIKPKPRGNLVTRMLKRASLKGR